MSTASNTLPLKLMMSALEIFVAAGAAFGVFVIVSRFACAWARCVDVSGLPYFLAAAVLGLAIAIAYWIHALRVGDRFRHRLVLDVIVVLLSIVAVLIPAPAHRSELPRIPGFVPRSPSSVPSAPFSAPVVPSPAAPDNGPANISR